MFYRSTGGTGAPVRCPLVNDHDLYFGLRASAHDRQCAYRNLFRAQIPEVYIHDIRECLAYNHPLGNDRFWKQVESTLGKRVGRRQRGRPPKHVDAPR
jgi:putative transposase